MECPGITFAVQWKKKSRADDVISIGLWDLDDTCLDWQKFKSYVCQNLGTADNICIAYIDSDGDELPIDTECEFREALKFARQQACKGQETILKVDRQDGTGSSSPENKCQPNLEDGKDLLMLCHKEPEKTINKSLNIMSDNCRQEYSRELASDINAVEHPDLIRKIVEQLQKMNLDCSDSPPPWFKKYMQKIKNEIVAEVTRNILHEIEQVFPSQKIDYTRSRGSAWPLNKNKKKKKISDEESSDGTLGCETRDHKLLKKIEKLHKREKKLEKKLDSKLEKLENKTKRMMEKRSQCKARCERVFDKELCRTGRRHPGDLLFKTYLMDALLLKDGPTSEILISPGRHFTKIWEIMNAGTLPWTDKTELRQAWGTSGLEPEETIVKCPILQPGEKGKISVRFRAPEYPGTFKSYWHFYHMGDRFGHWIGCAVIVKCLTDNELSPEICDLPDNENKHSTILNGKMEPDFAREHQPHKNDADQKTVSLLQNTEYESDLESDNVSVISGPASASSESEEENFVVIPMPACFLCDVPLGNNDTVPVAVKLDPKKSHTNTNVNIDKIPKADYKEIVTQDISNSCEVSVEKEENVPLHSKNVKKVFAVDSMGCCVPVNYCNNVSICQEKEATFSQVNNIAEDENDESVDGPDRPNAQSTSDALDQDPFTNVIHILPETIVTGAVKVAFSAFNTARAVISNLRPRQSWDLSEWQEHNASLPPADAETRENLNVLVEMGFTNKLLNVFLLQQYENDVGKVVAELVTYKDINETRQ